MKNQTIKNEKRTIAINKVLRYCKFNEFSEDETVRIIEGFIFELDYIEIYLQREDSTAGLITELNKLVNTDLTLYFGDVVKGYSESTLKSLNLSIIFNLIEFINDLLDITDDAAKITKLKKFKDLLYSRITD